MTDRQTHTHTHTDRQTDTDTKTHRRTHAHTHTHRRVRAHTHTHTMATRRFDERLLPLSLRERAPDAHSLGSRAAEGGESEGGEGMPRRLSSRTLSSLSDLSQLSQTAPTGRHGSSEAGLDASCEAHLLEMDPTHDLGQTHLEQQIQRERRRVRAREKEKEADAGGDAMQRERDARLALESDLWCRIVETFSICVPARVSPEEARQALRTRILQPHALLDRPDVYLYQEKTGNVFFMLDSIERDRGPALTSVHLNAADSSKHPSVAAPAKIVFRVLGITAPSEELTCQFAGVLQSSVDDMVLRRIATTLMRHRQPKLTTEDIQVIAPPGEAPSCQGTIYIPQRFSKAVLPLYIERALYKLLAPLRVIRGDGEGADSREHSPVLGLSVSNWQPVSVHDPSSGRQTDVEEGEGDTDSVGSENDEGEGV